jgi:hypothetical protein
MAIDFIPDEESHHPSSSPFTAPDQGHAELQEAIPVAIRSTLPWLLAGAVFLAVGVLIMKGSILAGESLLRQTSGAYWYAWVPAILFGFYGIVFGGAIGWRTSSASGLTGAPAWAIGALCTLLLALAGVLTAALVFPHTIPTLFWVDTGVMSAGSLLGVSVFALWVD